MKEITIQISDDDWRELEMGWDIWADESYALHAAYYFREALIRAGYMKDTD